MGFSETGVNEDMQTDKNLQQLECEFAEIGQERMNLCHEVESQWLDVPQHAIVYLAKHCPKPELMSQAILEVKKLLSENPTILDDPELASMLIDECIANSELVVVSSEIAEEQQSNVNKKSKNDILLQINTETANLKGREKLLAANKFLEEQEISTDIKLELQNHFTRIAVTLDQMSNVFTDDIKRNAFEQIVSSADLNLGATTLEETFAPVLAQVEAAGIFSNTEKRRLRLIVTGSQAQDILAETTTDQNGKVIPVWPENNPMQVRPGLSMYADANMNQILQAKYNGHIITIDTTGWTGEVVGKYLEVLSFVHDMESFGGTGILQSIYKIDFNLFGDEGFDMAKIDQILNIMGKLFGGLEHADGDIARAGQRQGYIRFLARLLNKRGTAMGHEESQADTNEVIHELQLHNPDGSPNWKQIEKLGQFAQRTYLSGDANYEDLKEFLISDGSQVS